MKPRIQLLLVIAAGGVLFFTALGRLSLTEPDEGRNAEVAREMLAAHDWVTPHFDTLPYLDKPAFFFWSVASSFKLFGLSEWAARFPSAVAALGAMLLICLLARRMFGAPAGLAAGLIFATSPLVLVFAREVIFDMTLTFLITVALCAFWFLQGATARERWWLEAAMFLAAGFAAITKGPVGFLVPLLVILLYSFLARRTPDLKRIRWGIGGLLFLVAALPWFVAVSLRNPGFPRYAFWDESVLRFATGHARRGGSVFYYIPVFLAGFLPWSFALVAAGLNRAKSWRRLRDPSFNAQCFLLSWAVVVFVFFSISHSKLPAYFLPALPALAAMMAKVWTDDVDGSPGWRRPDWLTATFALMVALGLLLAVAPSWLAGSAAWKTLGKKVHPAVFGLLPSAIFYSGLIVAALGLLGRNLASRARGRLATAGCFAVLACAMPLLAVRCWQPIAAYARTASTKRLANSIKSVGDRPIYGYYTFHTSLPFYLQRPVGLVTADGDELTSNYIVACWHALPGAADAKPSTEPPLFLTGAGLSQLAQAQTVPFLIFVSNDEVEDIVNLGGSVDPLWQAWRYSVWSVSPAPRSAPAPEPPGAH